MNCTPEVCLRPRRQEGRGLIALLFLALVLVAPGLAAAQSDAELMERARAALARGDGISAEADLRRLLAKGTPRESVAARMGEALLYQRKPDKAREWLGEGRFAKGEAAWGFRMLGRLERNAGNLPAAGRAYDRALALTPRDSQLWVDIARLRYMGGEHMQAIGAADHAVELDPENIRALQFKAKLVRDSFGYEAALPWYEAALAVAPDDVSLLNDYAASLGDLGRAKDMLVVTRKVLELTPNEPTALFLQAVLAARAGNLAVARTLFARTDDRLRDLPAAMLLQGALELEEGSPTFAVEVLDRLARRQPANPRVQLLLARAMFEAEEYDDLLARFGGLAARPDAPTYLLTLLAWAHEERGDRAAAAPLLDRARDAAFPPVMAIAEGAAPEILAGRWRDHQGEAWYAAPLLRSLVGAGNGGAATQVAERLRSIRPGSADALMLAGDVQLAAGQPGYALERYSLSAQILYPDNLLLRITEANARLGRDGANPGLAFGYVAAYPASRLAARMVGGYAALAGDWPRSQTLLENLRARGAGRDVRLLCDLSLAQLRSGDRIAALESARSAYALQRSSPVATQALAMALVANRAELSLARELIGKARKIGGDNALLRATEKQLAAAAAR